MRSEDFGYQLGRYWGIGQKDKNNGALLIVAQAERKVRIEVGYGLEGALTDALSANIVNAVIVPQFKRGQFAAGIEQGTQAVMAALKGEYQPQPVQSKRSARGGSMIWFLLVFVGMMFFRSFGGPGGGFGGRRGLFIPGGFGGGRLVALVEVVGLAAAVSLAAVAALAAVGHREDGDDIAD